MYASSLPEPWVIAELERQPRIRERQHDERPCLEIPLPHWPGRDSPEKDTARFIVVIDLW